MENMSRIDTKSVINGFKIYLMSANLNDLSILYKNITKAIIFICIN